MRRLIVLILAFLPCTASAASLYINPSEGSYGPGDTFIAELRINTEGDCINTADITVQYPQDSLRAVDFSRGDSILSLFVQEPTINDIAGTVTFSGGVPGGYCGRIQGDPALSNVLGKVVFTVLKNDSKKAEIHYSPTSLLYANDGAGTKILPKLVPAVITLAPVAQLSNNVWIDQVKNDTTPPEPFEVQVESTRGVFDGKYYVVFSTLDKQSGIDHYEIFERGSWRTITSPHELLRQSLFDGLQIRAIDKAGNMRIGMYTATSLPPLLAESDYTPLYICAALFVLVVFIKIYLDRRKKHESTTA